ncbi:methylated-DNA--[protein]-cysteine S-methyltransferase [Shewanella sp. SNU WT4]|uniref:methylated-DNA--[protein]-cysteine S-methyltransferase n=1 Tax=Shewanella sp. SNU WT4 TaxID=2590015 RepID=UPI00112B7DE0|nr:methylated-DNA--[protein]-cysteine S-methyltransferase [Shewanella sp. SNU WT4]QDF67570.1 methylated-DNA--[protein]-cysteine S-methyltransferase [Shewanella sp. SNU WT4]
MKNRKNLTNNAEANLNSNELVLRARPITTPLGLWWAEASKHGIRRLTPEVIDHSNVNSAANNWNVNLQDDLSAIAAHLDLLTLELNHYFAGKLQQFTVALDIAGTTFQRQVWQGLQQIPYGSYCSYADLAVNVGRPKAFRAVGTANGANQIAIVIPCHRVIGSNGKLTGYAHGLDVKEYLLRLEHVARAISLVYGRV